MADAIKGKDTLMKKLLSTAPNMAIMGSVHIPVLPESMSPASDSSEDSSTKLSSFLRHLARQSGRELNIVMMDHPYSKPGNWHSENTYAKPAKTLFVLNVSPSGTEDDELDVEEISETPLPPYDVGLVSSSMLECENYIHSVKPGERSDEWEEQVNRAGWTSSQNRLFAKLVRALHLDRLARLACAGNCNEPVQRRTIVDKTARRVRHLLACYSWEPRLTHWLHSTMLDCLSPQYLSIYLDMLQTMHGKAPMLVDRMLASVPISSRPGLSGLESMNLVLKQPWDPVASSLNEHRPRKLPGNPILVMVPSTPYSGFLQPSRWKMWESYFSSLGMVVTVMVKTGPETSKMTLSSCLDQMMCATRVKVAQLHAEYPSRHVILVGWNAGASLACQVALVEQVSAVVCLGFPVFTVEGRRGEPNDTLLDIRSPIFFVIGQNAATARHEDLEDIRERMRVETGLVVVGSADDQLRVGRTKKHIDGVTQSMVDRCILDEIGDFLGSILLLPRPAPLRMVPNQSTNGTGLSDSLSSGAIRTEKRKITGSEPSSPAAKRSRPGTPLHGNLTTTMATVASPVATQSPAVSTIPTVMSVTGPKVGRPKARMTAQRLQTNSVGRPKARLPVQKLQSNSGQTTAGQQVGSGSDQASSGITVNIGSLGSLTPIGQIRLGQTGAPSPSLGESPGEQGHLAQRGRGTSLTIQGSLISPAVSKTGKGRGGGVKGSELTSLSSLLQGGPRLTSPASSLLLSPSSTAGGQQLKVVGSEESLQGITFSSATPTVPSTRMRTTTGRMLDLSKLTVLTSASSGSGKNLLGTTSGGNVVMLTETPRGSRPGPVLVPVSTVASPFTILPLAGKNAGQRSYTVVPKISVPSLKLSQSTAQHMSGSKLTYTVASISQSSEQESVEDKPTDSKEYDEDTLTPDKILELPIIFAKDGDDSLFTDNKSTQSALEPPTVVPISSCEGPSPTLTLGDTISFPLEDNETERMMEISKSTASTRTVPNVFIIRSKHSKEKPQGVGNKRIIQKTHRFLRAIDKIPQQSQTNVKHGTGIKYTKIILTNRSSSLKVGDLELASGNSVSVMKDSEPSPLNDESLNVENSEV